ncbi:hypothetical protein F5Y16DRAFT_268149 [Xylariaceae sp. FL0255]|nr:hypothetical protein F5Y16DRAFT_268149 [Xylariaceae sp. FL0255]
MTFTDLLRSIASRPRSSTKGPLDADDNPLASPLSPQIQQRLGSNPSSRNASPRTSLSQTRSPVRHSGGGPSSLITDASSVTTKDFSFLLKPEIYHQISPLTISPPFRTPSRQPSADTPIATLLANGHFRAAAIAAAQELTDTNPPSSITGRGPKPVNPTDHARIFNLLYIRLSCLCLIDAVPLAAQEAKALEDLNAVFYSDAETGAHLAPWALRVLAVRLQTIGFGDPRRSVMAYYELAREARTEITRAVRSHDHSASETWKARLADLGVKVAGALIEMDDLAGAAAHLASLPGAGGDGRLVVCRALLWLHLGDVDSAKRCVDGLKNAGDGGRTDTAARVVDALIDMADAEYAAALEKWKILWDEMKSGDGDAEADTGTRDEMVGVNLAVCLLYTGRMSEGREILEDLVDHGLASHTLLFNLTTMYELCTDRAKNLKTRLAERVADMHISSNGSVCEKTNADFKL